MTMERLSVYVETSVVSYLTARPGRDVVVAGRQVSTRLWWEQAQREQQLVTSDEVLRESAHGDPEAARARLAVLASLPCLNINDDVRGLAEVYRRALALPDRAAADAVHLALASVHRLDAIASWNCCHIASAQVQRMVSVVNQRLGLPVPYLATPEMLLGEETADEP